MIPHRKIAMTARPLATLLVAASAIALSGCDWFGGGSSADTQMKNVEILPGTASDEMITLDTASGDGTAIDTSTAIGPGVPVTAGEAQDDGETVDGDTPTSSDDPTEVTDTASGDVVIRPPAGGAEPDTPAKK
jgi:hypothetical protein